MYTIAIELRLTLECAGCEEQTVLPGLVDEARCRACGRACRVSAARWSRALDEPIRYSLDKLDADRWAADEDPAGELGVAFRRRPVACRRCRAPIRPETLAAGSVRCSCGASWQVRALPAELDAFGLPRPAWVVAEHGPVVVTEGSDQWDDSIWIVAHLPRASGFVWGALSEEIHGLAGTRDGDLVVLFQEKDHARVARLDGDEIVWVAEHIGFDDDAYVISCPSTDEVMIIDPVANSVQFVDTRDGRLVRTLQGPAPEHERRDEKDFRRREPQTIDVHQLRGGVGIGPDGTITIVRDWYDGLPKSLRRFDREGRPLPPWRKRPGVLSRWLLESDVVAWQRMPDRPAAVSPWSDRFAVGRDGSLLLYGREDDQHWLVRWAADGTHLGSTVLPAWLAGVTAIATDATGTPIFLCDREGERVVAVLKSGTLAVIAGPFDSMERHLHVFDDGRIAISGRGDALRVLAPDGAVSWKSRATARAERKRQMP